jgi:hypothetical protein
MIIISDNKPTAVFTKRMSKISSVYDNFGCRLIYPLTVLVSHRAILTPAPKAVVVESEQAHQMVQNSNLICLIWGQDE